MSVQPSLAVERIKQYPGPVQVLRKVTVQVPGKHFTGLTSVEAGNFYEAQAVEYAEEYAGSRVRRRSPPRASRRSFPAPASLQKRQSPPAPCCCSAS